MTLACDLKTLGWVLLTAGIVMWIMDRGDL